MIDCINLNLFILPGAAHSDSILREFTCVMDNTVAATNQGNPSIEHTAIKIESINKSR